MKISDFRNLLEHGHEIELNYKGKRYSFTFGEEDGKQVVAFCEFYKPDIAFEKIEDILAASYDGFKVSDMIESLSENDIDVF